MTPEEDFAQDVRTTLRKIKRLLLATREGQPVEFRLNSVIGAGIVSAQEEGRILQKLEEWGGIKFDGLRSVEGKWITAGGMVTFLVNNSKFEEIYNEYENKINVGKATVLGSKNTGKTYDDFTNDLRRLQNQYQSLKDYPEREFFLGLADYVKLVVETPGLDSIADLIGQQRKDDEKTITSLESQVREDLGKVEGEVLGVIKREKIDFPLLKDALDSYEGVRDGRIQSSAQLEEALWGEMTRVVNILYENGYSEVVKKYVILNPDDNRIVGYSLSSVYPDYKSELDKYRDLMEKTVWGSWNHLVLVYLTVHKYDEELKRLDPEKNVWQRMNFIGLCGEMKEITENKLGERIEFQKDKYRLYLERVNRFVVEKMFPMYPVIQSVLERVSEYKLDTSFLRAPELYLKNVQDTIGTVQSFANSIQLAMGSVSNIANAVQNYGKIVGSISEGMTRLSSLPSISLPVAGLSGFSESKWRGEVLTRLNSIEERLNPNFNYQALEIENGNGHQRKQSVREEIVAGKLRYSFKSCELSYGDGKGVDAPQDNKEVKFFLSLCDRKGEVVDYKDLCRDASTGWYKSESEDGTVSHEDLDNISFSEDAGYLRRGFRDLAISAGMPDEEFKKLIKTVSKRGYKLIVG